MKKNKILSKVAVFCLSTVILTTLPGVVFAETTTSASPSGIRTNTATEKMNANSETRINNVKERADTEITRRISAINALIARINGMKRLADSDKTNLLNIANSMISELNTLKAKIDANTDLATLKTDRQSIFTQYRIYMLFMPQLRIFVAADRVDDSVDLIEQVITKFQAVVTTDTQKGLLSDAQGKLDDAKKQAQSAIDAVKNLKPDGGNDGIASTNKQALLSAKNFLMAALSDLQASRLDLTKVRSSLKGSSSPTSTP